MLDRDEDTLASTAAAPMPAWAIEVSKVRRSEDADMKYVALGVLISLFILLAMALLFGDRDMSVQPTALPWLQEVPR